MDNSELLLDASKRALHYIESLEQRRVFPDENALNKLMELEERLPAKGCSSHEVLGQLDHIGSPATVASSGPNYYGFVIGGTLPVADAAERLTLAWDQCASGEVNSPIAHALEKIAGNWVKDILKLPLTSVVGFGTSATACGLSCLSTARRSLLAQQGWDSDERGLHGAPTVRVFVSEKVHVTILKALRILGFGKQQITFLGCDSAGRILPDNLPEFDNKTILCLQAGEVNTGEFDDFKTIIPQAQTKGAWVHVDGAFGLWARASEKLAHLTEGVDHADSWTTDGHKWLNTPYDCAMAICRHPEVFSQTLNGDAVYAHSGVSAQKNLTLEFSRRARGIPVWAVLKCLGQEGVAAMIEKHCNLAAQIKRKLAALGYVVLNRVVLNQVLVRCENDEDTTAIMKAAQQSGKVWFGASVWDNRPAFRISVSSWRTQESHVDTLTEVLSHLAEHQREATSS